MVGMPKAGVWWVVSNGFVIVGGSWMIAAAACTDVLFAT